MSRHDPFASPNDPAPIPAPKAKRFRATKAAPHEPSGVEIPPPVTAMDHVILKLPDAAVIHLLKQDERVCHPLAVREARTALRAHCAANPAVTDWRVAWAAVFPAADPQEVDARDARSDEAWQPGHGVVDNPLPHRDSVLPESLPHHVPGLVELEHFEPPVDAPVPPKPVFVIGEWTEPDIIALISRIEDGQKILVATKDLGIPTIHDLSSNGRHMGYGCFKLETDDYEINFDAGGAMSKTPSGQSYTCIGECRGEFPYDREAILARLHALIAPPVVVDCAVVDFTRLQRDLAAGAVLTPKPTLPHESEARADAILQRPLSPDTHVIEVDFTPHSEIPTPHFIQHPPAAAVNLLTAGLSFHDRRAARAARLRLLTS